MYYLGLFMFEQFPEGDEREDVDFFHFPWRSTPAGASDAIDAPIDGY